MNGATFHLVERLKYVWWTGEKANKNLLKNRTKNILKLSNILLKNCINLPKKIFKKLPLKTAQKFTPPPKKKKKTVKTLAQETI